ncbi:unnamed protein product [Cochlearia groenlandica]
MNCLLNKILNSLKISPFSSSSSSSTYRLLSSITNSQNPLPPSTNSIPFNPFDFFNDQTNSSLCNLRATKTLQAHLIRRYLLPFDAFITKSLLNWYSNTCSMAYAAKVFDTMPKPDVVSCNIMLSGYKQNRLFEESLRFFTKMQFLGYEANEISYGSVISACTSLKDSLYSQLVCCYAIKMGFFLYEVVQSAIIDSFSKSRRFEDAYKVFSEILSPNVYCWNTIIAGALRNQDYGAVFDLFHRMCGGFQRPDSYTYSTVLAACASLEKLRFGRAVQARVIICGAEDVFVSTAIVDLYAKCGHMDESREVFFRIRNPSVVSWTVMLSCFTKSNDAFSAFEIFKEMRRTGVEINSCTVTSVIAACGRPSMVYEASQVNAWVIKSGFYLDSSVAASLISMYSKSGDIDLSEQIFNDLDDDVQKPNVANVMVSSFSQHKKPGKAIRLFKRMLQEGFRPDEFSVCSLLSVLDSLNLGKQIHSYTFKSGLVLDLTVGSSLFTMYSKCGSLEESFSLFKQIPVKDNACWASMISGYNEYGYLREAIDLFVEMLADGTFPDESTLAAVLTVCASLPSLPRSKEIHGYALRAGIDKGMTLGSALVNTYSKCGSQKLARQVYDSLPEMDPVSCSSLISGYSQHGLIQDGFLLFRNMVTYGFTIDSFAVSSILKAAALSDKSSLGAQVHAYVTKVGLCTEPSVGSSLLTMYSKFGSIEDCCKAFNQINCPDLIAWTALIASYAQHGMATEALQVYNLMKEKGLKPDKVTFVGVLSACSHGGLVEEGYLHLNSMVEDYGIEPENRHYACMIDALGRSGRLREAEGFINNMPIKADALVWGTLLSACKLYEDVEVGKLAAKKAMELEPSDAGAHVSLSNILAEVGEWEEVEEIRKRMKGTSLKKEPGWSSV